jgi:uncharacterized protein YbjT (DUF2867 family)
LVTGATGYIGSRLVTELLERGHAVRTLQRDPSRGGVPDAVDARQGDAVSGRGLHAALEGCRVAYYLIHSMESGGDGSFAERDRKAAANFGEAARAAGVERVIYMGGLGPDENVSEHLRSRAEVARMLRASVPGLVHVRAAMVIGAGSASFVMMRDLVRRLPAMICPRWITTRSQPVAVSDVLSTLAVLAEREEVPEEVQLGGADVVTYREMMGRTADAMGRRRPVMIGVPVLTPRLSSYWVGLVTPVEPALARPLIDGLSVEMVVTQPPPPGINDAPLGFDAAVRAALDGT